MVIIFTLFLIQFVYAGTVRITSPTAQPSFNINSTCNVNINNSDTLDGFHASYFYPYSNPYNFINITEDSWSTNYSLYYTKIEVDTNFSLYYLSSIINQILSGNITSAETYANSILSNNLTNYYNKSQVDYNFSLISDSWSKNYTNYYNKTQIDNNFTLYYLLTNPYNFVNSTYNETYHNYVTANYSNNSLFWQGHTGTDGSWLTGISTYNSSYVPYTGATSNVNLGSNQLYFGSYPFVYGLTEHEFRIQVSDGSSFSFLDYGGNLIITGYSGGNDVNLGSITYPFTRAIFDTLTISGANITDSTGAITFDNENLTTSSYGFFGWLGSLTNRITKAWFTNLDLNGTIQMNQGNITNATYIIMNEKSGACDLTINHSWCSNITGSYFVG
jgi:hypothetical protein